MRSDAFDQQRELRMKGGGGNGEEGSWEGKDLGMIQAEDGDGKHDENTCEEGEDEEARKEGNDGHSADD